MDVISVAILGQSERAVGGGEGVFILRDVPIAESVGSPNLWSGGVGEEEFGGELTCCAQATRDIDVSWMIYFVEKAR